MDNDFIEKIKKDLGKSGFGSELNVRRILQDNGWSISGGSAYFDKDEEKSREIDAIAHRSSLVRHEEQCLVFNSFLLFIEVKKTEKPWVVFRRNTEKHFDSCAWNNIINSINLPCEPRFLTKRLMEYSLLKINKWEGTGMHEAFKIPNQPSQWYGAFLTASKAAIDYKEENGSDGEQVTTDILQNPTEITFHQPLVVLDGVLLSAELNKDNDVEIQEVFEFRGHLT